MPVLVRDDVGLRERTALRPEARLQLLKEADVEIDLLVIRTVEGSGRGARRAAGSFRVPAEDHRSRRRIRRPAPRELVAPVLLHAVDEADDTAVLALVRVHAGPTVLDRLNALDRRLGGRRVDHAGRVDAE